MKKSKVKTNLPLFITVRLQNKNDGRGRWLLLPAVNEQFASTVNDVCDNLEDLIISECRCTVPGLSAVQVQQATVAKLNYLASRLNTLTNEQVLTLTAVMNSPNAFDSIDKLIEYTYNPDSFSLIPGIYTQKQLGRLRASELNLSGLPDGLRECIDTAVLGAQSARNEDGQFTPIGYISARSNAQLKLDSCLTRFVPAELDLKGLDNEDLYIGVENGFNEDEEVPEAEDETETELI